MIKLCKWIAPRIILSVLIYIGFSILQILRGESVLVGPDGWEHNVVVTILVFLLIGLISGSFVEPQDEGDKRN